MCLRFAQALEVVPRVLAENSGVEAKEVISSLYAAHAEGKKNVGFDIEGDAGDVKVCSNCSSSLSVTYVSVNFHLLILSR